MRYNRTDNRTDGQKLDEANHLVRGMGILIDGCRNTEEGKAALAAWDEYRARKEK